MDKYFLCNQLEEGISIDSLIQNGDTSAILVSGRRELLQRVTADSASRGISLLRNAGQQIVPNCCKRFQM